MSVTETSTSVSSEILKFYVIGQRWLVGIGNVREVSVEIFQLRVGCIFMTKAFWKYFLSFLKINFNGKFWGEKRVQPVETKWRPKNSKKNKKIKQTQFFFKNEISDFYSFGVRKGFKGSLCIHLWPSCLGSNLSTFKRETASLYIQAVAISKMSSARNANLRF